MLSIDWISGSIPRERADVLIEYLERLFQYEPETKSFGLYRYDYQKHWQSHIASVYLDKTPAKSDLVHGGRSLFVITGTGLKLLTAKEIFDLVNFLVFNCWFKATRLDCAYDDFAKTITPTQVWQDCCLERRYTRFKRCGHIHEVNAKGDTVSDTVTFGQRGENGSGSFVRFYRKDLESKGEIDAHRWEVEFSQEKAREAFFMLSKSRNLDDFTTLIGAYVAGSIDFVQRKGKNLSRGTRVEWWAVIVERLGSCRMRGRQSVSKIQNTQKWIERSVSCSLATMEKAFGQEKFYDWLYALVSIGSAKMGQKQMFALEQWQQENQIMCECYFEEMALP